ncbi:uncharacterized protein N0V89_010856 [Didymosphaeria variabile]|uniref:Telomeric single stranded DNA binding POT1/Cdc13 domain-containing protein n=1 Tax=Didymosphaeria variabile TaxID=1932322 RepID=A0A9W8XCE7_9PLEO|nr:uncharacterized protein N0V89_010856 [Didymosphaeria variabile]KAJ4346923.1 hypothetical protein N0V89_010856 [Didymosphaeria variabile]
MEYTSIAELKPELPALESKQIRGVVTLIWPYSSSARQFAFLLGDPDFRRRRKDGQVRVRFSGSSARAMASTNIGIGDEVVLSLRGVVFVKEKDVSTPGKSVDWELAYKQTLSSRVVRQGEELADLDLINVAPTPAPASPVRATPRASIESSSQWSSPAFLKRSRFSNGPVVAPPIDPFADDIEDGHAKKRRRRSYRDWNAWTYLARTPSPEKEDVSMDESGRPDTSPVRPVLLPATPVSPSKLPANADTGSPEESHGQNSDTEDHGQGAGKSNHSVGKDGSYERPQPGIDGTNDDLVQDASYYDLYAGLDEQPPAPYEVARSSDTEPNTDEEDPSEDSYIQMSQGTQHPDDIGMRELMHVNDDEMSDVAVIEADEIQETPYVDGNAGSGPENSSVAAAEEEVSEIVNPLSENVTTEPIEDKMIHSTQMHSVTEVKSEEHDVLTSKTSQTRMQDGSQKSDNPIVLDNVIDDAPQAPHLVMPPPTLSLLQTDFQTSYVPGTLTPIGKEPSSPNLQPLDSSTLPMPSPFPGGRDGNVSSFLDYISTPQQSAPQSVAGETRHEIPHDEADYILETSFYSSVSSYRAPAFHPTHESAFTDVRFTFGMDGAAFSRPQTSSGANEASNEPPISKEAADGAALSDPVQIKHSSIEHDRDITEAPEPIYTFLASPSVIQHHEPIETVFLSSSSEDVERNEQPDIEMEETTQKNDEEKAKIGGLDDEPARNVEREEQADIGLADERHESNNEGVLDEVFEDRPVVLDAMVDQGKVDEAEPDRSTGAVDAGIDHHTDSEDFHASQVDATPGPWTQQSAVAPEVIDLGSPSNDSDKDETSNQVVETRISVDAIQEQPHEESDRAERTIPREHVREDKLEPDHSEDAVLLEDKAPSNRSQDDVPVELNEAATRAIKPEPTEDVAIHVEVGSVTNHPDTLLTDLTSTQEDVKIESVEEAFSSFVHDDDDDDDDDVEQGDDASSIDDHSELLIAVPAEGHKVGELEFVSVPDAAPARSTRSKTKTSISPEKEAHAFAKATRARKRGSLASLSQLSQRTISPPATRSRSIITPTPTKESFSASNYNLRSQSKHHSPTKLNIASAKKTHSRKGSAQTNSSAEPSAQQASFTQDSSNTDLDFPWTNFGPSQELGTLQGKYANVPYVKDSEEGSMRSDQSLSTVQYSDDWNMNINFSDTPLPDGQVRGPESTPWKRRTASRDPTTPVTPVQNAAIQVASTTRRASQKSVSPFATQLPLSSPIKSVVSIAVASSSPRRSRRVNKDSIDLRAGADQDTELGSSPPATYQLDKSTEYALRSPRAEKNKAASANQQSVLPMTPEATQHINGESQPSFSTAQDQSLPMTPQLTQSVSAARHSFQANSSEEDDTLVQHGSGFRSTPRRDATATDIASPLDSHRPSVHSASADEADLAEVERPFVGLSTPIAYYTPLKDLLYFLNRSSKFHSAGSPDVLALVTSASTPPSRATKGPKHHTTSLHITDLSVYPSQTTVQIFRAYADALPVAEGGDVVLLRAFNVKSVNRHPCLVSADESAWCVWRYGKPHWGKKRGRFSEVRSREEVKGPAVERGEGEWGEVEKLRAWWTETVKREVEEKARRTRSKDKQGEASQSQSQT